MWLYLFYSPISDISFTINSMEEIDRISNFLNKEGKTLININLKSKDNNLLFQLKNKRELDRKTINLLRNEQISTQIN